MAEKLEEMLKYIIGDILVSSSIITYLGSFSQNFRTKCISNWVEQLKQLNIKTSDTVSLEKILGEQIEI